MGNFRWQVGGCGCDCLPSFGSCGGENVFVDAKCLFGVGLTEQETRTIMLQWDMKYRDISFSTTYVTEAPTGWMRIICDHSTETEVESAGLVSSYYDFHSKFLTTWSIASGYSAVINDLSQYPPMDDGGIILSSCLLLHPFSYETSVIFPSSGINRQNTEIVISGEPAFYDDTKHRFYLSVVFVEEILVSFSPVQPRYKRVLSSYRSSRSKTAINSYVLYLQSRPATQGEEKKWNSGTAYSSTQSPLVAITPRDISNRNTLHIPTSSSYPIYGQSSWGESYSRYFKYTADVQYYWNVGQSTISSPTPDTITLADDGVSVLLGDKTIVREDASLIFVSYSYTTTEIEEDEFVLNSTPQNTIPLPDYSRGDPRERLVTVISSFLKSNSDVLLETYPISESSKSAVIFREMALAESNYSNEMIPSIPVDRSLCVEK